MSRCQNGKRRMSRGVYVTSGVLEPLKRHWMALLLTGVPAAAGLQYVSPERHAAIFSASAVAIVPLAAYIGRATDDLSARFGGGLAGLLNATFGNAAELIFVSYVIAPAPMDLLFTVFEVAAVGLSVITISLIAHDGETHWMEGVQLLAVYAILALGFYFLPSPGGGGTF